MAEKSDRPHREANHTQAWLIGSGIASLTAAVHLIKDAKIPGSNIHILDLHSGSGGGMKPSGDAVNGYFLPFDCHPHFHGSSMERLLSLVPSQDQPDKSIMDAIRRYGKLERPPPQDFSHTRAVKQGESGPEVVDTNGIHIGVKNRMALMKILLESEETIGSRSIENVLDKSFFRTTFWMLWATTFGLQPWHSAVEFRRHLRKYLEDIHSLNNLKTSNRTEYNLYESIIIPITSYLKGEDVDFRFNTEVTNLGFYPESDPATVTRIELLKDGAEQWIQVDPTDIVIVTLGSTTAGAVLGTNTSSPPSLSVSWEEQMDRDWRLWQKLSQVSPKFGDPAQFLSQTLRAIVETFTTTFQGPEFMELYEGLAHDRPGTGALVSLAESNWSITISIPHQPVFPNQSNDTNIIYGYALSPTSQGNYVKKLMYECCGEEILIEVLSHLKFPIETILPTSKTIPCGTPLGTAPFLSRNSQSRPHIIPQHTSNLACVGQFVEIKDDTTLAMEYSVRGAQMSVSALMGLPQTPSRIRKNLLLEIFDLMI